MLTFGFVTAILLQVLLPVALVYFLIRRYGTELRLCLVGGIACLAFWALQPAVVQLVEGTDWFAAQINELPTVWILLMEGLVLALVEQAIRAGAFWYARDRVKRWGEGLTLTAGQAGLGLLLIGLQLLLFFVSWTSLSSSRGEGLNLSSEELATLNASIASFWALEWYFPLLVALQSLVILTMQFALGMMTWQAVNQKAWVWLGSAVLWETALNTLFKVLSLNDAALGNTALFVLAALVNVGVVLLLYRKTRAFELVLVAKTLSNK